MSDTAGSSVDWVCPVCGGLIEAEAWSCAACGAPLVPKQPPRAVKTGGHQRRSSHGYTTTHGRTIAQPRPPVRIPRAILITASFVIVALMALAYAAGVVAR